MKVGDDTYAILTSDGYVATGSRGPCLSSIPSLLEAVLAGDRKRLERRNGTRLLRVAKVRLVEVPAQPSPEVP